LCPPVGPQTSAEAICGGKVILGLEQAGVQMDVIAFDQAGAPTDRSSFWQGLDDRVVRFPEQSSGSRWSRLAKVARHGIIHWIEWTDRVISFALRQHQQRPYDLVYSRSLPAAAHLAGFRISRLLRLPWVANMNDPWGPSVTPSCDDKVGFVERTLTLFWLRRTLRTADLVTYPSDRLAYWHRKVGGPERRLEVIPHIGYCKSASKGAPDKFVVTHAGSLISGRSGAVLLEAFAKFIEDQPEARTVARLRFVGQIDAASKEEIARRNLSELVSCTGTVSYESSLEYISDSTVLVLIEKAYPEGLFLPSKLCDYFAAGRPVLALSPEVGVVSDLAARHRGIMRISPADRAGVLQALRRLYGSWRERKLEDLTLDPELARMVSAEVLTEKLIQSLASVCRSVATPLPTAVCA
jgi:hypothetical protein